jgi:hypothetical protein
MGRADSGGDQQGRSGEAERRATPSFMRAHGESRGAVKATPSRQRRRKQPTIVPRATLMPAPARFRSGASHDGTNRWHLGTRRTLPPTSA